MVKVSTILPGSSYASGVFTIPWTSLNAILTTPITPIDSFEAMLFAITEALYQRQTDGFITQPTVSCEISNRQYNKGVWEETAGLFSSADLLSTLITYDLDTSPSFSGNSIHPTSG
jgi:hypothetical protein